jgi:hypothetical protein
MEELEGKSGVEEEEGGWKIWEGVWGEENKKAGERKRAENEGNKGHEGGNLVRI